MATPGQALNTAKKIEKGETGLDHSPGIADIAAPAIVTLQRLLQTATKGWAQPL